MDRFFSKLDLRDIKIDPFKASYPPDAEEAVEAGFRVMRALVSAQLTAPQPITSRPLQGGEAVAAHDGSTF